MTQIEQEQWLSKKFSLTNDKKHDCLYALTIENVARIEAIICIDSKYKKSGDPSEKLARHYKGSTAYWMGELKYALEKNISDPTFIYNAVCAVDRDNSKHLAADKTADLGKYYPVSYMAADGRLVCVLCRNEYLRQSTLFFISPMAVDCVTRRTAI